MKAALNALCRKTISGVLFLQVRTLSVIPLHFPCKTTEWKKRGRGKILVFM